MKQGQAEVGSPHNCAFSSPALGHDGTLYVGSNARQIHAISSDGRMLWSFTATAGFSSTPAILPSGEIMAGNDDGTVYVLARDGSVARKVRTNGPVRSSAAIGADGTAYVGSDDGLLYAIRLRRRGALAVPGGGSRAVVAGHRARRHHRVRVADKSVYGVGPDGQLRFRFRTTSAVASSPAIGGTARCTSGRTTGRCMRSIARASCGGRS
ncbi:MAG: PQQ-binding-like beta-propeller repeat protein [Polyangiaceae bacterium]